MRWCVNEHQCFNGISWMSIEENIMECWWGHWYDMSTMNLRLTSAALLGGLILFHSSASSTRSCNWSDHCLQGLKLLSYHLLIMSHEPLCSWLVSKPFLCFFLISISFFMWYTSWAIQASENPTHVVFGGGDLLLSGDHQIVNQSYTAYSHYLVCSPCMIYIATDPLEFDLIRSQPDFRMVAKQLFHCFDLYTVLFA